MDIFAEKIQKLRKEVGDLWNVKYFSFLFNLLFTRFPHFSLI